MAWVSDMTLHSASPMLTAKLQPSARFELSARLRICWMTMS